MRTIAVMTGRAGAGKTTVAMQLVEQFGWHRVRFAEKLKAMARALGLNDDEIEGHLKEVPCSKLTFDNIMSSLVGDIDAIMDTIAPELIRVVTDCDEPQEVFGGKSLNYAGTTFVHVVLACVAKGEAAGGATPRSLMQMIGTDWGRKMIREDLWVDLWRRAVAATPEDATIVIDDCRFPNERTECLAQGDTVVFRITRVAPILGELESQHESEAYNLPADYEVDNNATVADAVESVRQCMWITKHRASTVGSVS